MILKDMAPSAQDNIRLFTQAISLNDSSTCLCDASRPTLNGVLTEAGPLTEQNRNNKKMYAKKISIDIGKVENHDTL